MAAGRDPMPVCQARLANGARADNLAGRRVSVIVQQQAIRDHAQAMAGSSPERTAVLVAEGRRARDSGSSPHNGAPATCVTA